MSDEYPADGIGSADIKELKWNLTTVHLGNRRYLPVHKRKLFRVQPKLDVRQEKRKPTHFKRWDFPKLNMVEHHAGVESIPEIIPQLVVPDLTDCPLRPYVSYKTTDIYQEPFTAQDLFNVTYGKKILSDFKEGKLDSQTGQPLEPSPEEAMTKEEAEIKMRQTGSDIFQGGVEKSKLWNVRFENPMEKLGAVKPKSWS